MSESIEYCTWFFILLIYFELRDFKKEILDQISSVKNSINAVNAEKVEDYEL